LPQVRGPSERREPNERDPRVGLCGDCEHCRIVKSQRSSFYMCQLSFTNPEYRKYPPLPVLRCHGYQPGPPANGQEEGSGKLSE
jgi:hypothetical protein